MSRIEIGVGAIVAALAGFGWATSAAFNAVLIVLGVSLAAHGAYDVYIKPNLWLEKTVRRWMVRRGWSILNLDPPPPDAFFFTVWLQDDSRRRIIISRDKQTRGLLTFTAPLSLNQEILNGIMTRLSATQQQNLYEELHIALASMHLAYSSVRFDIAAVQHALPIDEFLSEHSIDIKAKEVLDGVIVARSLIRKTVRR